MFDELIKQRADELSNRIIGAAIEVHRHLGPGLLESAYEACLCYELTQMRIQFERQSPLPINYKGVLFDCAYRIDILVEGLLIIELKSVERLERIHQAQMLSYLRLKKCWLGLLMNFNVELLRDGIKRLVLN